MDEDRTQNLFVPLKPEKLLHAKQYHPLDGQIMFWHGEWQEYVITVIADEKNYTVRDYNILPEGAPYQLIQGKLVFMAAPNDTHQKISMRLSIMLGNYIMENNLGELRAAPYDVQLDQENILQPDLLFVSIKRVSRIKQKLFGAPDFVVEILSVGNQKTDREIKKQLYGSHGVLEYWIVHPTDQYIEVHHNEGHEMKLIHTAYKGDIISSKAIAGLELVVAQVFG